VYCTDGDSWNNKRPAGVALAFQVRKHVIEAHADVSSNILSNDPSWPELVHEPIKFRPEVAVICLALSLPGLTKGLAWVSTANNINWSDILAPQLSNVFELRHVWPMLRQHLARKLLNLTERVSSACDCNFVSIETPRTLPVTICCYCLLNFVLFQKPRSTRHTPVIIHRFNLYHPIPHVLSVTHRPALGLDFATSLLLGITKFKPKISTFFFDVTVCYKRFALCQSDPPMHPFAWTDNVVPFSHPDLTPLKKLPTWRRSDFNLHSGGL
jgi:hypothetical protein